MFFDNKAIVHHSSKFHFIFLFFFLTLKINPRSCPDMLSNLKIFGIPAVRKFYFFRCSLVEITIYKHIYMYVHTYIYILYFQTESCVFATSKQFLTMVLIKTWVKKVSSNRANLLVWLTDFVVTLSQNVINDDDQN